MGAFLQRLLQYHWPDTHPQHVYATLGCCSNIRIEDTQEIEPCVKEHDPGDLGRLETARVGQSL